MNNPAASKKTPSRRKRAALRCAGVAVFVASIAVFLGFQLAPHSQPLSAHPVADPTCTNCMTISATQNPPALYPGAAPTPIPVMFTNVTSVPIHVSSLTVDFTKTSFANGCSISDFAVDDANKSTDGAQVTWSGSTATVTFTPQTISGNSSGPNQSWTAPITLALKDSGANQDACQNQSLSMSYTGAAYYQVPTTTLMTTSPNSSADSETLTATVAPDVQPTSAALTSPDGGVFFYLCSNNTSATSCTTQLNSTAAPLSNGVASITTSASAVGSYNVEAVYSPSTTTNNFITSTSSIVVENLSGCVNAPTGNATLPPLNLGQSANGISVGSGQSYWLNGGTINGNVTVAAGGSFAATGGTVKGNITSTGGPIAMAGTTVTGNVQSSGGGVALGPGAVVKGNVQASGNGVVCSDGTVAQGTQAANPVQVQGNLTLQSLSSSTTATICSTIVSNNLQWQSNSEAAVIGGNGASCGPNTVLGNLLVQNNSGNVTIGTASGNNVISGNANVNGNSGGGTIAGNKITGNCTLSGDKPGIVGTGNNTGKGNNQCNTASAGA